MKSIQSAFTLIEILVVLSIFTLLAIILTQGVFLSLRGTRKSEAIGRVRENLDYAVSIMERQLHSATSVSPCPNSDTTSISLTDQGGATTTFSCLNLGQKGYIASSSARLTSDEIGITSCSIVCTKASGTNPPSLTLNFTAKDALTSGVEAAQVTSSTTVYLRTY